MCSLTTLWPFNIQPCSAPPSPPQTPTLTLTQNKHVSSMRQGCPSIGYWDIASFPVAYQGAEQQDLSLSSIQITGLRDAGHAASTHTAACLVNMQKCRKHVSVWGSKEVGGSCVCAGVGEPLIQSSEVMLQWFFHIRSVSLLRFNQSSIDPVITVLRHVPAGHREISLSLDWEDGEMIH